LDGPATLLATAFALSSATGVPADDWPVGVWAPGVTDLDAEGPATDPPWLATVLWVMTPFPPAVVVAVDPPPVEV
jgi:hypothetical protein